MRKNNRRVCRSRPITFPPSGNMYGTVRDGKKKKMGAATRRLFDQEFAFPALIYFAAHGHFDIIVYNMCTVLQQTPR